MLSTSIHRLRDLAVVQFERHVPQRLKPRSKQCRYRSAEALRHPKSRARSSFSAGCEAVPFQNKFKLTHYPESISGDEIFHGIPHPSGRGWCIPIFWWALICRDEKSSARKNLAGALHTGGGRCMLSRSGKSNLGRHGEASGQQTQEVTAVAGQPATADFTFRAK
jgi:hypothetical protein